ncbi:MAG: hypothetical protein HYS98_02650 [Deltaproteobacteria bacterium]|nr:hypothetical protein [Deltaproteobacteria bacterium]
MCLFKMKKIALIFILLLSVGVIYADGGGEEDQQDQIATPPAAARNDEPEKLAQLFSKENLIGDRALIKQRVKTLYDHAATEAHTITLLIAIGFSENILDKIHEYQTEGKATSLAEIWKEFYMLAGDTTVSTPLWGQIAGSRLGGLSEKIGIGALDKGIQWKTGQRAALSRAVFASFWMRQTLGFVGFFGWEWGRHLMTKTLRDFHDHIRSDGSDANDIDIIRAQSILKILRYKELREEFLASFFYVLSQEEHLLESFASALKTWSTFDLLGTFTALGAGSHLGRVVVQRSILGLSTAIYGRIAGQGVAQVVARSFLGRACFFFGPIPFVVVLAILKDTKPVRDQLLMLDRWTDYKPALNLYSRAAGGLITDMRSPSWNWRFGLDDFFKSKPVGIDIFNEKMSVYRKRVEELIDSHLTIMGDFLQIFNSEFSHLWSTPKEELRVAYEYYQGHQENKNPPLSSPLPQGEMEVTQEQMLNELYLKYLEESNKLKDMEKEFEELKNNVEVFWGFYRSKKWEEFKEKLIDTKYPEDQKADARENLSFDRYYEQLQYLLDLALSQKPLLNQDVELKLPSGLMVHKKLLEWIVDGKSGKEALHKALLAEGGKLTKLERNMQRAMEMIYGSPSNLNGNLRSYPSLWDNIKNVTQQLSTFWLSKGRVMPQLQESQIELDNHYLGKDVSQAIRDFNLQSNRFFADLDERVSDIAGLIRDQVWREYPVADQPQIQAILVAELKAIERMHVSFRDLWLWNEMDYEFIMKKADFIARWKTESFSSRLFDKEYEVLRKNLDDHTAVALIDESAKELTDMVYEDMKAKNGEEEFETMMQDESIHEEIENAVSAFVIANISDVIKDKMKDKQVASSFSFQNTILRERLIDKYLKSSHDMERKLKRKLRADFFEARHKDMGQRQFDVKYDADPEFKAEMNRQARQYADERIEEALREELEKALFAK